MKRTAMLVLVGACLLVPVEARANDGGWWDWLWKWDAKFWGVGTDIHVLCLDSSGNRLAGCENWFTNIGRGISGKGIRTTVAARDIKHQIDLRTGFYWNHGSRYDPPNERDGNMFALKLMAIYNYHVNRYVALSGGMGYLPVWGEGFRDDVESRGIFSTGLLFHIPKAEMFTVRPELSFIAGGFTAAEFGNPDVSYAKNNIVNFSVAIGIDLRRLAP
jgi:hypothetical protein